MSRLVIGDWIRRERITTDRPLGLGHLVESLIERGAITRCGRRMEPWIRSEPFTELTRLDGDQIAEARHKLQLCKACDGKQ
jgi:hypothetical protein